MKKTSALLGATLALVVSAGIAMPAAAHSVLLASNPVDGSTISTLPDTFSVTANEPLLDLGGDASGFAIQVVDAAGTYYGDGCFVVTDATLSMGATLGEPGAYRLYYQFVSADGHTVSGELAFTWAPDASQAITAGLGAPPVCGETVAEPTPEATPVEPTPTPSETPTAAESAEPDPELTNTSSEFWSSPLPIVFGVVGGLVVLAAVILVVRARRNPPQDPTSN